MAVDRLELWFNQVMLMADRGRRAEAVKIANHILKYSRKNHCQQGIFYHYLLGAKTAKNEAVRQCHRRKALECSHRYGHHGILHLEIQADPALGQLIKVISDKNGYLGSLPSLLKASRRTSGSKGEVGIRARLLVTMEFMDAAGKPIDFGWRTRKVKSLFAYLLLNQRRFCHREELIEALWPASPLDKAKKELHHTAFMLRKNLRDGFKAAGLTGEEFWEPVKQQSQGYRLYPDLEIGLDIEELEMIRNSASQSHPEA